MGIRASLAPGQALFCFRFVFLFGSSFPPSCITCSLDLLSSFTVLAPPPPQYPTSSRDVSFMHPSEEQ